VNTTAKLTDSVIRVRLFYCRSRKVHLGYQKRVGERKCEISSLSIPTKIRLLAGWTLAPTLQIRNERQRTSTTLFTVARWCSLSLVGVHCRSPLSALFPTCIFDSRGVRRHLRPGHCDTGCLPASQISCCFGTSEDY
jgi:hypothetical protein